MATPIPVNIAYDFPFPRTPERIEWPERTRSSNLRSAVHRVLPRYPDPLQAGQYDDLERILFHLEQVYQPGASIADLGGGIGLFSPTCAEAGMRTHLIDDFCDVINNEFPIESLGVHRESGVCVVDTEVRHWGKYFDDESLDVVTSFDSIEHWHHSPRLVFEEAHRVLKPGGRLFIGAPNAVNLAKRIAVPLGRTNWSDFEDWYHPDEFRGHVREPVLADLLRIVDELGFERSTVWGRNWAGYAGHRARRLVTAVIDRPLRAFPTLCSDIYVMATKPS